MRNKLLVGCHSSNTKLLPAAGSSDSSVVKFRGKPHFSDGSIEISVREIGSGTNRLIESYPVKTKNLTFGDGDNWRQIIWANDKCPPPLMLESNAVYTFEIGTKVTDAGTAPDGTGYMLRRFYLRRLWKGDTLLLENWDPEERLHNTN